MFLRESPGRAAHLGSWFLVIYGTVALPFTLCVTLGMHPPLYQPWFAHLENGDDEAYLREVPFTSI